MAVLRGLVLVLIAAALFPDAASAADRFVVRDEPLGAAGSAARTAQRPAPVEFNLVGLHWRGPGTVGFRTLSRAGEWSPWRIAGAEGEDAPDQDTAEGRAHRRWRFGSPYWTGSSASIQYRFAGRVSALRAYFIWSDPGRSDGLEGTVLARAAKPAIISRSEWNADESIVRARPSYASAVRFAVVHHTAGTNSYSAAQSAAIVRGIERYHVLANGWNDIGYNFLVDKYGQIFEGRAGGIARNVIGAHAEGFNTGSTGIAVLGSYSSQRISAQARAALVRLLAWRLDVAHVDPLGRLTWISGGNPEYPAGTPVRLRAISGHRDTGPTSCPGSALYAQLPGVATDVAATGLPKLYSPVVSGSLGGPIRFTARLSTALDWTVTIRDETGEVEAAGSGTGTAIDWTWDASAIPFGNFTYTFTAGPNVRPARGAVPGPPPLVVTRLKARPHVLTPNGDGIAESTRISYALSGPAAVGLDVLNDSGAVVRSLFTGRSYRDGTASVRWDGRNTGGKRVRDGRYRLRLTANSPGQAVTKTRGIVVDRTLGHLEVSPSPFSPNRDGRLDTTAIAFRLSRQADVRVQIMDGSGVVRLLHAAAALGAGAPTFLWGGRSDGGTRAVDGVYTARVEATTALGTRTLSVPLTLDTRAPVVRVRSVVRRGDRLFVRFWLSEAATLRVRWGSPEWQSGGSRNIERPAGRSHAWVPAATRVRLQGVDAAQNVGPRVIGKPS